MFKLLNPYGQVEALMVRNSVIGMCIGGHCTQLILFSTIDSSQYINTM